MTSHAERKRRKGRARAKVSLPGSEAIPHFVKRGSSRFDRKAAEKELGPLDRFDVKSETVALMVSELVRVEE